MFKVGAAVCNYKYLLIAQKHSLFPLSKMPAPWKFWPRNPPPATTTYVMKLKLNAVVCTNKCLPAIQNK